MIWYLVKDAKEKGIQNIEVLNKSWQEISDPDIRKKFDIVTCSHLLWQFQNVAKQLERMEDASKGYCCVVHPAGGADIMVKVLWPAATGKEYAGEVDPDLDDLVFVILRQRGILVNVRVIDYTTRLSVEQEVRLLTRLLGKHAEMSPPLRRFIRRRVMEKSSDSVYETKNNAVVMWWEVPPPSNSRQGREHGAVRQRDGESNNQGG